MDIGEFEDLVDRLGEDVSRWPAPSREAAEALLGQSGEAREIVARAIALRRALSVPSSDMAPAGLADRIAARAFAASPPRPKAAPKAAALPPPSQGVLTRPAIALALCFAVGVAVGLLTTQAQSDAARVDFVTLLSRLTD